VSANDTQGKRLNPLAILRRGLVFDERRRLILLFLMINALVLILIWLFWQNQVLIQENTVLETRLVVAETQVVENVTTCEVGCTDKMSTVASRLGTEIAQASTRSGTLIASLPSPGMSTATLVSLTPIDTPTLVPTLANTPTSPSTPTDTPTMTPTPTATSTPKPKPPDIPTPPPPPEVWGISPTMTVRTSATPFFVTITGQDFDLRSVTACLGASFPITIVDHTATFIIGTLSPNMSAGVYGLTVTNSDGQSDVLSPAFIVHESYGITIALESPYLVTFGAGGTEPYNDRRYQKQEIFFEVPTTSLSNGDSLFINILDAETGGKVDDDQGDGYDTTTRYTVYGKAGAITSADIGPGFPITDSLDDKWNFTLDSFSLAQGELVEGRYIFTLTVEGLGGNDANWYRVALSNSRYTNTIPSDVQMYAYSWVSLVNKTYQPYLYLYPYIPESLAGAVGPSDNTLWLQSFGCEYAVEYLWIRTPLREMRASCLVTDGRFWPTYFPVDEGEEGATWTAGLIAPAVAKTDYLGFSAAGERDVPLRIYTRPMIATLSDTDVR